MKDMETNAQTTTNGLDDQTVAAIKQAVDAHFDEQVAYIEQLVRFPSVRGREATVQDFLAADLAARGYSVDRWLIDPAEIASMPGVGAVTIPYDQAINVVGTHRAAVTKGRSLILNGHVDVVPTGPLDMWDRDPFDPHREGDWLFGRGAGDMKAGISECVYAMAALRQLGCVPAADVYLQTVVEEECTGNGALACVKRGYRADAAIIPEPVGDLSASAQLGVLWFQVTLHGHPVHVQETEHGSNAVESAFSLIRALRALERRWNLVLPRPAAYQNVPNALKLNIGKISGGDWASSVPAWCRFDCRISLYPDQDIDAARAEIEDCIRTASLEDEFLRQLPATVQWNGFNSRGCVMETDSAAARCLAQAHQDAYGEALRHEPLTATTDAKAFMLYGNTPALVYGPYAEDIHGFNERVSLESVRKNTQAIALFIARWCGLEHGGA